MYLQCFNGSLEKMCLLKFLNIKGLDLSFPAFTVLNNVCLFPLTNLLSFYLEKIFTRILIGKY